VQVVSNELNCVIQSIIFHSGFEVLNTGYYVPLLQDTWYQWH